MDLSLIETICGKIPVGFVLPEIKNNYIFQVDPSFTPINLNTFFGNAVTVNSFIECVHYVSGGYEPEKTTIFDLLIVILGVIITSYSIYRLYKFKVHKKISKIFLHFKNYIIFKIKKPEFFIPLLPVVFFIQNIFIFDYIRTKSSRLPRFIDEYISLSSNINFYKNLDFNAGDIFGGSYSIFLTSGPISAIGGVLGWNFTSKLVIARISNFYWLIFLQLILSYLLIRKKTQTKVFILFSTTLIFILTPWWQSSLYMIGEFASVILFINGVFLFFYYRKLAMILISLSIFYGKLLTLLPFLIFYLILFNDERNLKNLKNDIIYFSIPLLLWGLLVNFNYDNGNLIIYIRDLLNLIQNHQSSGIGLFNKIRSFNLTIFFSSSEVSSWNNFEIFRVLVLPLIFVYLVKRNISEINSFFGNISVPLIGSILSIYFWFWILSPTKWIRYSQHFTLVILISLMYFVNFKITKSKLDLFLSFSAIGIFIDNSKYLIMVLIVLIVLIVNNKNILQKDTYLKIFLILIITIDITIPYFEKNTFADVNDQILECLEDFSSDDCRNAYINE